MTTLSIVQEFLCHFLAKMFVIPYNEEMRLCFGSSSIIFFHKQHANGQEKIDLTVCDILNQLNFVAIYRSFLRFSFQRNQVCVKKYIFYCQHISLVLLSSKLIFVFVHRRYC